MSRIDDIKKRLTAATPGPWMKDKDGDVTTVTRSHGKRMMVAGPLSCFPKNNDAELIANAPADIAFLIECLEMAIRALESITYDHYEKIGLGTFPRETLEEAIKYDTCIAKDILAAIRERMEVKKG